MRRGTRVLTLDNNGLDFMEVCRKGEPVWYWYIRATPRPDFYCAESKVVENVPCDLVVLSCDDGKAVVPMDWTILVLDRETADTEFIPAGRIPAGFTPLVINPLTSYTISSSEMILDGLHRDVVWVIPEMSNTEALVYPLAEGYDPPCVVVARPMTRLLRYMDIGDIL